MTPASATATANGAMRSKMSEPVEECPACRTMVPYEQGDESVRCGCGEIIELLSEVDRAYYKREGEYLEAEATNWRPDND